MWRSKKFILIVALGAVVLAGSIGGIALAQTGSTDNSSKPAATLTALWDRVIAIYQQKTGVTLDKTALQDSLAQARKDIQNEALKTKLQAMVTAGKITQAQADEYLQWTESRPDVPVNLGPNLKGGRGFMMGGRGMPCFPRGSGTPSTSTPIK